METSEQIERFKDFIETNYLDKVHELVRKGEVSLVINFKDLSELDPELSELLLENPEDLVRAAELALEEFDLPETDFRVRFMGLPETQKLMIRNVRSEHLNLFLSIEGIIKQASDVRPQVVSAKFECPSCGNIITILQIDTKFKEPSRCSCGRKGRFRLIHKDLVDAQRLIIEEMPESLGGGEQPKRLSVFLKEDLVDPKMERRTTPGSKVLITGVVKEIPVMMKTGVQSTSYELIMEANHIESVEETFFDIDLSKEDEKEIIELSKDPKIYENFRKSIAPSVYGHEILKEALVLQLMGGVKKTREDGTFIRGDMHILLVGDPGAAKSTLLTFISKVAPKARYVAGKSVSAAGLTATVVRDDYMRGWALEAGAMVLANNGIVCLDELDKMSVEDTSALHEAMAQQTISISKANIQATLRTQTTVLAAANPKFGRFDPYTPIAAQIDMPPTLINRFDLIFPIRDIPSRELDEKIATHVLLSTQRPETVVAPIDKNTFKKYIAYVKQRIFPKLTTEAIDEIKTFYVNLRNLGQTEDDVAVKPIPISARQLEALIRLGEGSARVRLSEEVTRDDAKKAISLLKHCLMQVGFDYETGQIDIDRIGGVPASTRGKIISVRGIIQDLEKKIGKTIPLEDIMAEAQGRGIEESKVEEAIEKLKRSGDIFEPRKNFIQRI